MNVDLIKKSLEEKKPRCKRLYDMYGEEISNQYINADDELITICKKNINFQLSVRGGHLELIHYIKPLLVPEHVVTDSDLISSEYTAIEVENFIGARKFQLDKKGIAQPKLDKQGTLHDLINSLERSSLRSKKNFYNYALSNDWEYFCTFTFAETETRLNKDLLFGQWNDFVRSLRRKYSDIKALATYERFKNRDSGFHMHCLLAACDLLLKPARNFDTKEFIYTGFNNQIFNCIDWNQGHNTVVCISPDSNQSQVVNYMSKYMSKECPAPYGCKRYFHTQNLDCGINYMGFKSFDDIQDIINVLSLTVPEHKQGRGSGDVVYYTNNA